MAAVETAIIEMWTRRVEMLVSTPLMLTVRHSHPALAALEKQVPEVAETNRRGAERALKVLERRLGESEFIAADRVTMADILAATAIDFSRMAKFSVPEEFTNVRRWYEAMMARDAAKAGI